MLLTGLLAAADAARSGAPPLPWALGAAATAALSAVLLVAIVAVFSCASRGCFEQQRRPVAALAARALAAGRARPERGGDARRPRAAAR